MPLDKPTFSPPGNPDEQALLDNVRPAGWINPEPVGCYNLVVIGAGTAGLVCAAGASGLGAKVALIERHKLGGDCLNYGCVPSKGIIRAARAVHEARNAAVFGVAGGEALTVDFAAAMKRMHRLQTSISRHDSAIRFRDELGVDVFFGDASFVGSDCVKVGGARLNFHRAAICTGARAVIPNIPGLEAASCLTNESVFSLERLPPRLAVLGGGPIGCELAQAFARFGSRVTIIDQGPHLLPREDREAAELIERAFVREGIDLRLNANIARAELRGSEKVIVIESEGSTAEVAADEILVAVGRAPNIEGLNLEKAGIAYDHSGIRVDETLQTSNRRVYSAGDVCFPWKFTHTADELARIVITNALFPARRKTSALTIPWCTYTDPEVAHVGMYEQQALDKGIEVQTLTVPLDEIDRAVLDGETEGFARVHLRKGTDKILGATIVARHAGEMISEMTTAITNGLGLSAIGKTIHPYPTQSEVMRKLADAWNRNRLTPGARKALNVWFRWQRS